MWTILKKELTSIWNSPGMGDVLEELARRLTGVDVEDILTDSFLLDVLNGSYKPTSFDTYVRES